MAVNEADGCRNICYILCSLFECILYLFTSRLGLLVCGIALTTYPTCKPHKVSRSDDLNSYSHVVCELLAQHGRAARAPPFVARTWLPIGAGSRVGIPNRRRELTFDPVTFVSRPSKGQPPSKPSA